MEAMDTLFQNEQSSIVKEVAAVLNNEGKMKGHESPVLKQGLKRGGKLQVLII